MVEFSIIGFVEVDFPYFDTSVRHLIDEVYIASEQ